MRPRQGAPEPSKGYVIVLGRQEAPLTTPTTAKPRTETPLEQSWVRFLEELSGSYADTVRALWCVLRTRVPGLSPPRAGGFPDGLFQMAWEDQTMHVSVDVYADHAEWFASDLKTGALSGDDFDIRRVPDDLIAALKRYA